VIEAGNEQGLRFSHGELDVAVTGTDLLLRSGGGIETAVAAGCFLQHIAGERDVDTLDPDDRRARGLCPVGVVCRYQNREKNNDCPHRLLACELGATGLSSLPVGCACEVAMTLL
jgi:hypothetical protein